MRCGTGFLRVAFQGLSRLFLKTLAAIFPDPTDHPWARPTGMTLGLFSQTQKLEPPCTAYQKIPQESAV